MVCLGVARLINGPHGAHAEGGIGCGGSVAGGRNGDCDRQLTSRLISHAWIVDRLAPTEE